MSSIEEKLSLVGDKFTLIKTGEVAKEIKVQSERRSRTAIAFLLIMIADWSMSFVIPILQGRAPLTVEAISISIFLLFFYFSFIVVGKFYQYLDIRSIQKWLEVASDIQDSKLADVRKKEMFEIEMTRLRSEIDFRMESLKTLITTGASLFQVTGGEAVQQRQDWTPMTEAFIKTLRYVDNQLLYREMQETALTLLEEKMPLLAESLQLLTKHVGDLEAREKKRDELLFTLSGKVDSLSNRKEKSSS